MKISVITPVYNRSDCISRCIESVIGQGRSEDFSWEHIIVDDGSSDDTVKIVKAYCGNMDNMKLIRFLKNKGTNAARNEAIAHATGDYCILLDSDDYFRSNALVTVAKVIKDNPSYKEFAFAADDRQDYYNSLPMLKNGKVAVFTFADFLLGKVTGDFVHVVRTDILQKYPFDEYVRILEGVFFLRFYREAGKILFTNIVITNRDRGRADSVTLTGIEISRGAIQKACTTTNFHIRWFKEDYQRLSAQKEWGRLLRRKTRYCIMLGEYSEAYTLKRELESMNISLPIYLRILLSLKLGVAYQKMFSYLLRKKYNIK